MKKTFAYADIQTNEMEHKCIIVDYVEFQALFMLTMIIMCITIIRCFVVNMSLRL